MDKQKTTKQIKEEIIEALEERKAPLGNMIGGLVSILFSLSILTAGIGIATKSLKKEGILK